MSLSEEQKNTVAKWFAAGEGLAEIQKRISSEFGMDLTYLDVRLLVADLPQPIEQEEPNPAEEPAGQANPKYPEEPGNPEYPEEPGVPGDNEDPEESGISGDPGEPGDPEDTGDTPLAELSVVVDPLAPPGAIACGSVTFSDGTTGKWMLDQMGRLGLSGLPEGYRPSPEDGAQFQPKLLAALRAKGLV